MFDIITTCGEMDMVSLLRHLIFSASIVHERGETFVTMKEMVL